MRAGRFSEKTFRLERKLTDVKKILTAAAVAAVMCGSASAVAADFKIGLVSPARILAESAPAVAAQEKLKTYFKKREDELNRDIRDFRTRAQKFEKTLP